MPSDREQALETAGETLAKGRACDVVENVADALLEAEARGREWAAEEISKVDLTGNPFTSEIQLVFVLALNAGATKLRKQKGRR